MAAFTAPSAYVASGGKSKRRATCPCLKCGVEDGVPQARRGRRPGASAPDATHGRAEAPLDLRPLEGRGEEPVT